MALLSGVSFLSLILSVCLVCVSVNKISRKINNGLLFGLSLLYEPSKKFLDFESRMVSTSGSLGYKIVPQ